MWNLKTCQWTFCTLWISISLSCSLNLLPLHGLVTQCISYVENIGLLSYIDFLNIDTFHYTKKNPHKTSHCWCHHKTHQKSSEVLRSPQVHSGRYKFPQILIFTWQHVFYHWQYIIYFPWSGRLNLFSRKCLLNTQVWKTIIVCHCPMKKIASSAAKSERLTGAFPEDSHHPRCPAWCSWIPPIWSHRIVKVEIQWNQ